VVDDAALMVNPYDEAELAAAIGRLLDDSDLRATLRVKGLIRAGQFEWNQTARRTLEIYQRVAERRGP
jgi:glycosyltransferase involved in cell wall biosynthesis